MRSNLSERQRRSMISTMDLRAAIYDRSESQAYFPSKKFAEEVFYSIEFGQPPDWSINPEISLRGSEPRYRSGRSTVPIVNRIKAWARTNPTRFKFKVERSYLLNQYVGGQGSGWRWMVHYSSDNQPMILDGIDRGGWNRVDSSRDLAKAMNAVKRADMFRFVDVPTTKWSLASAKPFLDYNVRIQQLMGDRIGQTPVLPDWWPTGLWGYNPKDNDMCFWMCLARCFDTKLKKGRILGVAKKLFKT